MNEDLDIVKLNKEALDNAVESYNQESHGKIYSLFNYFCKNLPKKGFILDLGSGTGLLCAELLTEKGFEVLGIELSSKMIKIAKKNVPSAKFKEMSITDLNFKKEFDGIFSSYSMLQLNPNLLKELLKKIVQALKIGGLFYLCLNAPWAEGTDLDKDVIIKFKGKKMYSRPYTKKEVLNFFIPLGMKLLKFENEIITSETWGKRKYEHLYLHKN